MYKTTTATAVAFILLATVSRSSPVPESGLPNSATVVDVASATSYSSLIMANPSQLASPPDQPDEGTADADAYITPSDIDLPSAATLSLSGTLPALPSSSTPSPLGSSETGGVRVVGQDVSKSDTGAGTGTDAGSATTENTDDSNDEADQPNSAGSSVRTSAGVWAGAGAVTGLVVFVGLL